MSSSIPGIIDLFEIRASFQVVYLKIICNMFGNGNCMIIYNNNFNVFHLNIIFSYTSSWFISLTRINSVIRPQDVFFFM